jgi:hypothetical protein
MHGSYGLVLLKTVNICNSVVYIFLDRLLKDGRRLQVRMRNRYVRAKMQNTLLVTRGSVVQEQLKEKGAYIKHGESHHEPEITPVMAMKYVKTCSHEFVCRAYPTELAGRGCIGVGEIPARRRYVFVHVLAARLTRRGCYGDELDRRTVDLLLTHS